MNDLWTNDFRPVSEARAPEAPTVVNFHALRDHIGHAVDKIQQGDAAKAKEYVQRAQECNFEVHPGLLADIEAALKA